MKDEARVSLVAIVAKHGHDVAGDARRVEGLLRDHCGTCKAEIAVLAGAARERVPAELKSMNESVPSRVLVVQLSKRLQEHLAVTEEAATWAVESWALSLGLTTLVNARSGIGGEAPGRPDAQAMYREAAQRRFCTKCGADLTSSNAPPGLPAHCQECGAPNGEANGQSRASAAAQEMYRGAVGKKYCSRCGAAVVPPPVGQEWRCGECAHVIRTTSGRVQAQADAQSSNRAPARPVSGPQLGMRFCPECGIQMTVSEAIVPAEVRCPDCQHEFSVKPTSVTRAQPVIQPPQVSPVPRIDIPHRPTPSCTVSAHSDIADGLGPGASERTINEFNYDEPTSHAGEPPNSNMYWLVCGALLLAGVSWLAPLGTRESASGGLRQL